MKVKNILLCASGLTPQVVTETLYALAVKDKAMVPDELHVVTTTTGRNIALERLMHPEHGQLNTLCQEYGLAGKVRFGPDTVHVIGGDNALDDIRDADDNKATADSLMALVSTLIDRSERLHVSIAGGRKTMSFFIGAAMQLQAREQDELSHVLVSPPFESAPDFFYPPSTPRDVNFQDRASGEWFTQSTADANIELARLPFVRIREVLPEGFANAGLFEDAVFSAQNHLRVPAEIVFDSEKLSLSVDGVDVALQPQEAVVYGFLLKKRVECSVADCAGCDTCGTRPDEIEPDDILPMMARKYSMYTGKYEQLAEQINNRTDVANWFRQKLSAIKKKLLAVPGGSSLVVDRFGGYGDTHYFVSVDPESIIFK